MMETTLYEVLKTVPEKIEVEVENEELSKIISDFVDAIEEKGVHTHEVLYGIATKETKEGKRKEMKVVVTCGDGDEERVWKITSKIGGQMAVRLKDSLDYVVRVL